MAFAPATKQKSKLRLAVMGPSGSGKTFTALTLAVNLGKKVAVIDSERGSASKYSDIFSFDVCDLESHSPEVYVKNIKEAEAAGYDVLVIDSLSHAWMGKDGALEQVDKVQKRQQSGNSFTAWREVTPMHNALVDAILQSKCHVIATMRTKQEYVIEENDRGKKVPRKIGMAPIQRDGVEFEFDVIADMNIEHDFIVSKTRCSAIDGYVQRKPGKELAETLKAWLDGGAVPKQSNAQSAEKSAPTSGQQTASKTGASSAKQSEAQPQQSATTPTTGTADTATASTATTEKPASDAVNDAPKPVNTPSGAVSSAVADNASASPAGTNTEKVGAEQMQQLLTAGKANGWDRRQVSDFVCHAFNKTLDDITTITWKQWETAVRLVSQPKNKNGVVKYDSKGDELKPELHWPKPRTEEG